MLRRARESSDSTLSFASVSESSLRSSPVRRLPSVSASATVEPTNSTSSRRNFRIAPLLPHRNDADDSIGCASLASDEGMSSMEFLETESDGFSVSSSLDGLLSTSSSVACHSVSRISSPYVASGRTSIEVADNTTLNQTNTRDSSSPPRGQVVGKLEKALQDANGIAMLADSPAIDRTEKEGFFYFHAKSPQSSERSSNLKKPEMETGNSVVSFAASSAHRPRKSLPPSMRNGSSISKVSQNGTNADVELLLRTSDASRIDGSRLPHLTPHFRERERPVIRIVSSVDEDSEESDLGDDEETEQRSGNNRLLTKDNRVSVRLGGQPTRHHSSPSTLSDSLSSSRTDRKLAPSSHLPQTIVSPQSPTTSSCPHFSLTRGDAVRGNEDGSSSTLLNSNPFCVNVDPSPRMKSQVSSPEKAKLQPTLATSTPLSSPPPTSSVRGRISLFVSPDHGAIRSPSSLSSPPLVVSDTSVDNHHSSLPQMSPPPPPPPPLPPSRSSLSSPGPLSSRNGLPRSVLPSPGSPTSLLRARRFSSPSSML